MSEVCIKTVSSTAEAEFLVNRLKEFGIFARISSDDCGGVAHYMAFVGGVRIMVFEEDAKEALEILKEEDSNDSE